MAAKGTYVRLTTKCDEAIDQGVHGACLECLSIGRSHPLFDHEPWEELNGDVSECYLCGVEVSD